MRFLGVTAAYAQKLCVFVVHILYNRLMKLSKIMRKFVSFVFTSLYRHQADMKSANKQTKLKPTERIHKGIDDSVANTMEINSETPRKMFQRSKTIMLEEQWGNLLLPRFVQLLADLVLQIVSIQYGTH